MDNLLNELRGSIRRPLQKGEWDAIQYFGERCAESAACKRIAALEGILRRILESEDRLTAQVAIHNSLKARRVALAEARTILKETT
jgi:hypothetical protein